MLLYLGEQFIKNDEWRILAIDLATRKAAARKEMPAAEKGIGLRKYPQKRGNYRLFRYLFNIA